ncbi:MAG: septum formation family protein [Solirubrobacteraceae bacterium]
MNLLTSKPLLVALGVVAGVVILVVLFASGGDDDETSPQTGGAIAARDLRIGTCITDATSTQGDVRTFDAVACDKPHDGEVYTIIKLEGSRYPGTDDVTATGQRGCRARLRRQATAKAFRDRRLGFKFVYPTKQSWAQGDHDITCVATYTKARAEKLAQR